MDQPLTLHAPALTTAAGLVVPADQKDRFAVAHGVLFLADADRNTIVMRKGLLQGKTRCEPGGYKPQGKLQATSYNTSETFII